MAKKATIRRKKYKPFDTSKKEKRATPTMGTEKPVRAFSQLAIYTCNAPILRMDFPSQLLNKFTIFLSSIIHTFAR
ncbi:MAG: hypothetical protein J6T67_08720 [Paludibacteraceae bacterium]|nr:hypothetical protein [Paludibacteraceae bacterium]